MSSEQTVVPLPPPTTDPAPLSNIEGGETNLLHRTAWSDSSNPLKVCFDPWDNSQPSEKDPESIQILLNDVEITRKEWTAPMRMTSVGAWSTTNALAVNGRRTLMEKSSNVRFSVLMRRTTWTSWRRPSSVGSCDLFRIHQRERPVSIDRAHQYVDPGATGRSALSAQNLFYL